MAIARDETETIRDWSIDVMSTRLFPTASSSACSVNGLSHHAPFPEGAADPEDDAAPLPEGAEGGPQSDTMLASSQDSSGRSSRAIAPSTLR